MFSKRLKYIRKLRKLSQEELGKKINATKSTVSNYENEYSTPSNEVLKDLANVLHTTTDYLLGRTENINPSDKLDNEEQRKLATIEKIIRDFPDADPMFNDLASFTADDMDEVYDYIKYLKSKKTKGD